MKSIIVKKKSFKEKDAERTLEYKNLNKKMGSLAKASALFAKERYTEAFKAILVAVEIVKTELEERAVREAHRNTLLKSRLGLESDVDITPE
jgi:excinuclease UvrABC helicase subunit UvrB